MGVVPGNDQFCDVSICVPQLTISTIAESNISKQCPGSIFAFSPSSTISTGSEVMEISKYLEHNLFFHPKFPSLKMWTEASSTGHGTTIDVLRITKGFGANLK